MLGFPFDSTFGPSTKEMEENVVEKLRLLRKMYYLSPLVKIGCTSKMKINRNLFCISLGFHYLCNQVLANRRKRRKLRLGSLSAECRYDIEG